MAEVLIHGGIGGREVAIAQAMEASSEVTRVEFDGGDLKMGLDKFRTSSEKPLVIVGPEAPLVAGVADTLRDDGYPVFGASKAAAQYEASKSRAVRMARKANIVHPKTYIAEGVEMVENVMDFVSKHDPLGYVIKADGLAGGKGVVLPNTIEEAKATVTGMVDGSLFGGAGKEKILLAQRKHGPEVSAMVVVGGGKDDFTILPLSQDHKRLQDKDKGPNTGGMGAYAPVPQNIVSPAQYQKIYEKAYASLAGMEAEGVRYRGAVLYMGLMMSDDLKGEQANDSDLIEYNVRFGDPETQAILPLLQQAGVDVYRLLRSAAEGNLEKPDVDFANIGYAALSVCLAAEGYPDQPMKGDPIYGLRKEYEGVTVQLAGVTRDAEMARTNGGRVLYVTGVGETIHQAAKRAYAAIGKGAIHFAGMQYRKDIGWQAR